MKVLKLTRAQILSFAVKNNLEYAIKDLNYLASVIDGGTIEDFMSKAKFLSEYVQTHWIPSNDEVVFVYKQDILNLFDEMAVKTIVTICEIRYNQCFALDAPISILGEYQKYFNDEHYVQMKDIQHEDYLEFFYDSICAPVMNALKGVNIEVGDWTYIALIDFILGNIKPDQKELDECRTYLAGCSMAS